MCLFKKLKRINVLTVCIFVDEAGRMASFHSQFHSLCHPFFFLHITITALVPNFVIVQNMNDFRHKSFKKNPLKLRHGS